MKSIVIILMCAVFVGTLANTLTTEGITNPPLEEDNSTWDESNAWDDIEGDVWDEPMNFMDEMLDLDERIVGGVTTSVHLHPYQVSLEFNGKHICGGSIVQQNIIITAAHCVDPPQNPSLFQVRAGSSLIEAGGQLASVRRIFRHEGYNPRNMNNDVALIQLVGNLSYSRTVKSVRLATQLETIPKTDKLVVSGWGLTSEWGSLATVLRHVVVRYIDDEQCARNYQKLSSLTSTMFCAGYLRGGKDACQGDSGGPLVSYEGGRPVLYGVVSWGIGCAQKGYPGVYTKVSVLRPWINGRINLIKRSELLRI